MLPPQGAFPASASFTQEVETALESFDFLNYSDLEEGDEEKDEQEDEGEKEELEGKCEEDQNKTEEEKTEEGENNVEHLYSEGRSVSTGQKSFLVLVV